MEDYILVNNKPSILWAKIALIDDRIDTNPYKNNYIESDKVLVSSMPTRPIEDLLNNKKEMTGGATPLGANYLGKGINFIRTQNVGRNSFDLTNVVYISEEDHKKLARSALQQGDILLTITGADFGRIATVLSSHLPANINQHSVRIHFQKDIDPFFVSTFLNSTYGQNQIFRYSIGATRPAIDYTAIKKLKIPIPSPEIQKYIGNKVRQAEVLREEAKKSREGMAVKLYSTIELPSKLEDKNEKYNFINKQQLDNIRMDATYYMKKYIEYEKKLNEKEVVDLAIIIKDSKYGASISANYKETGIPFLRGLNLKENEIDNDIVYLDKSVKNEIGKAIVYSGDILITRSGTVGITAVVDKRQEGYAFGSFMIKLVINKEKWNPYYISAFLNSIWGKWQIERLKNGAVQQNINLQEIDRIIVPKVNLDKQNTFEIIIKEYNEKEFQFKQLILQAKQDVEDLIEGKFDLNKLTETNTESR